MCLVSSRPSGPLPALRPSSPPGECPKRTGQKLTVFPDLASEVLWHHLGKVSSDSTGRNRLRLFTGTWQSAITEKRVGRERWLRSPLKRNLPPAGCHACESPIAPVLRDPRTLAPVSSPRPRPGAPELGRCGPSVLALLVPRALLSSRPACHTIPRPALSGCSQNTYIYQANYVLQEPRYQEG